MSTANEGHECLRSGTKKRVYYISPEQQVIQVGLILKASRWNLEEKHALYNGTRLYCKSMPLTFSVEELALTSSDLRRIIPQDQPNIEQTEPEALMPESPMETTAHPVPSKRQSLTENPMDTATSPPTQETSVSVPELVSSNVHRIIAQDKPNVGQIELQNPVPASLAETTADLEPSNSQSLTENPSNTANTQPVQEILLPVPELDPSNVHKIIPQDQPNVEQMEPEAPMLASSVETTMDSVPSKSQILIENPTDTANSPSAQEALPSITKLDSSNLHNIVTSNQPNAGQIEPQALIPASLTETTTDLVPCNSQSLADNPTYKRNSSPSRETHLLEPDILPLSLNSSMLKYHLVMESLPDRSADDTADKQTCASNYPSTWIIQDLGPLKNQIEILNNHADLTGMVIDSQVTTDTQILVPASSLETNTLFPTPVTSENCCDDSIHAAYESLDTCDKQSSLLSLQPVSKLKHPSNETLRDIVIVKEAEPQKRKRPSKCQCSNCSVDGGNKTRSRNGEPLHKCDFPDCGKCFTRPYRLKRHLDCHGMENFFCAYCNKRFVLKDTLRDHIKKHMNSKPTECQCPNCSADGGNQTKDSNGRPLHKCHFPDCGKGFTRTYSLKRHLECHSSKNNFFCAHCNKRFVHKDILRNHIKMHMNCKSTKCKCPNCSVDGGNQTKGSNGRPLHKCHFPDCGKVFSRTDHLENHLNYHKKNFSCADCKKRFSSKNLLILHVQSCKKCQCPNCSAEGVNTIGDRKNKLHICFIPSCRKLFSNSKTLKRHLLWHRSKKHLFCEHCSKGFAHEDHLREHAKTHINL